MALTKVKDWNKIDPGRLAQVVVWGVRGTDGDAYVMEVDPATGAFPVASGSVFTGFGDPTVANRSAAVVGNATGALDCGPGVAGAQTLRVVGTTLGSAYAPVSRDFGSAALTANTWSQLIASTSAQSIRIQYLNDSGYPIEIGFGGAGAEASKAICGNGGEIDLLIPASTRLSLRCVSNVSSGIFWLAAYV